MKNSLLIFAVLLFATACRKSFLELTPPSAITTNNFFKTGADAITAVNGCYASLATNSEYGSAFQVLMEERGDNVLDLDISSGSGTNYKLAHFMDDPSNSLLSSTWIGIYNSIFRCNTVLDNINAVKMDSALKRRVRGEALFIRALNYFNLVRLWGAVPLVTTVLSSSQAMELKRDEPAAVYAQIEADLTFAVNNLPASYSGMDVGRVTTGAAGTLLGKVYLYEKKYTDAMSVLNNVINSGVFTLLPNVADVFNTTKKYNAEIVFAVRYASGITGQTHVFWFTDNNNLPTIDSSIITAYSAGDLRKPFTDAVKPAGFSYTGPRKFIDAPDATGNSGEDFPVLRYAEVLLMAAEAQNEAGYSPATGQGTAFYLLNQVRQRAGLPALSAADLPDQGSFRAEVYVQRRLELAFECDRWFDLVRTGNAIAAIKADAGKGMPTINVHRFIYPIPQSELDIINNPSIFSQNDGY